MAQLISPYEIELRLTNPNTHEISSVTRTEYAYTLMDAVMQANLAVAADAGSAEIKIVRVGPPSDLIHAAMTEAKTAIADMMRRIQERGPK